MFINQLIVLNSITKIAIIEVHHKFFYKKMQEKAKKVCFEGDDALSFVLFL